MFGDDREIAAVRVGPDRGLLRAAAEYVKGRQCPTGGFCYYRAGGVEEENAADTYAAVRSLHLVGDSASNSGALVKWILDLQDADGAYPNLTTAWFALGALDELDLEPRIDARPFLRRLAANLEPWGSGRNLSGSLRDAMRLALLCLRFRASMSPVERAIIESNVNSLSVPTGGFGVESANLIDTHHAVVALRVTGLAAHDQRQREFLSRCMDREAGFALVPGGSGVSTATTHAGLRLCALLGVPVAQATALAVSRFVLRCWHTGGGFGRAPGAIQTLDDTWLALECLLDPGLRSVRSGS